ncbi:hypothetical protein [Tsukamurella pseudospumae]|uniref:hypothetical protein n=1 Tax=Tsukamurella pseudospumae TaxID=239498 RepID=UPI000ABB5ABC|nr:hypothetical protein [Tsukamurella pseudospumae]
MSDFTDKQAEAANAILDAIIKKAPSGNSLDGLAQAYALVSQHPPKSGEGRSGRAVTG